MSLRTPNVVAKRPTAAITVFTPQATVGDTFENTGRETVFVRNASGAPITVTPDVIRTTDADGATVADPVYTVADGETWAFDWDPVTHNNGSNLTKYTCSAVTNVTSWITRK